MLLCSSLVLLWFLSCLYTRIADCFTHVPFQAAEATSTLSALRSLVDLYSFTDISANSGAPYDLKVDLRGALTAMENKVKSGGYGNDYAFQTDVLNAFNPLMDAHTLYRAPEGYQCFMLRPFNIEASLDESGKDMQYTLREGPLGANTAQVWKQVFGVDIKPLENLQVSSINGMSPTDHVMKVAAHFISTYKDHGVRFNAALRGRWSQTILSMFPVTDPAMDYQMQLRLANGQTVTVPNAGFCGAGGISSTQDLLNKNKASASAFEGLSKLQLINKVRDDHLLVRGIDVYKEQREIFEAAVHSSRISIAPSISTVSRRDDAYAISSSLVKAHDYSIAKQKFGDEFHYLPDQLHIPVSEKIVNFNPAHLHIITATKTMDTVFMIYNDTAQPTHYILRLTSFAPDDVDATIAVIQAMIKRGQAEGVKHLIMDVAYNGGGIICLSDLLLALLVPDWGSLDPGAAGPTLPYGIYDFRQSETSNAIRSNGQLNSIFTAYTGYLDISTEKEYTNNSFYKDIPRTRGGHTSQYTQQAYFPSECVGYPGGGFKAIPYYFSKVTVLTDGTCGSACALFASQLQSYNYAKVVSYGGPLHRKIPLSTASFAGGNVLEYGFISYYSWIFGSGTKGLPPLMTSSAAARFNFNEYYEYNELNTPREFLKRPADMHLDYFATLYNDDLNTQQGFANSGTLYAAVMGINM